MSNVAIIAIAIAIAAVPAAAQQRRAAAPPVPVATGKTAANGMPIYKIGKKECAPSARGAQAPVLNAAAKARGELICDKDDGVWPSPLSSGTRFSGAAFYLETIFK